MKSYSQIGTEIGELVERKNAAYGSSFAKAGEFLRLLYPDGLQPDQYDYALLLVRDFDKSMRIATDQDAFGESPFMDKAGYAILGAHMHQQRKASEQWQSGSANGSDAEQPSRAKDDGAPAAAAASSTPSRSASPAHAPSPQPDGFSAEPESAAVPTAMAVASPSAGASQSGLDLLILQLATLMRKCNEGQRCARCGCVANRAFFAVVFWGKIFLICHECKSETTYQPWQAAFTRHVQFIKRLPR